MIQGFVFGSLPVSFSLPFSILKPLNYSPRALASHSFSGRKFLILRLYHHTRFSPQTLPVSFLFCSIILAVKYDLGFCFWFFASSVLSTSLNSQTPKLQSMGASLPLLQWQKVFDFQTLPPDQILSTNITGKFFILFYNVGFRFWLLNMIQGFIFCC